VCKHNLYYAQQQYICWSMTNRAYVAAASLQHARPSAAPLRTCMMYSTFLLVMSEKLLSCKHNSNNKTAKSVSAAAKQCLYLGVCTRRPRSR
jgi:hypothetical protein